MLDFIGIGARRAGENWLFNQLRRHPEIHFPRNLEMGFWSKHYPCSLDDPNYTRDLEWYRSVFGQWKEDGTSHAPRVMSEAPRAPVGHERTWFDRLMAGLDSMQAAPSRSSEEQEVPREEKSKRPKYRQGDFSPSYCWFEEPRILPAIYAFAPQAKILYMVRHPYVRAWAAAQKAVLDSEMQPEEASDAWYKDHFNSYLSRKYGNYVRALTEWQAVYPQEQFLVVQFEDIFTRPRALLKACCSHIGVKQVHYFDSFADEAFAWEGLSGEVTEIRPSLLPFLEALYGEEVEELNKRFGIDYLYTPDAEASPVA